MAANPAAPGIPQALLQLALVAVIALPIAIAYAGWHLGRAAWELRHIARTLYYGDHHEHEVHDRIVAKRKRAPASET